MALGTSLPTAFPDSSGTQYYVDGVSGNDGRSKVQAQDIGTPWLTLENAISLVGSEAGAIINLRYASGHQYGGTDTDSIYINTSGSAGNPITIRTYPGDLSPGPPYHAKCSGKARISKYIDVPGQWWRFNYLKFERNYSSTDKRSNQFGNHPGGVVALWMRSSNWCCEGNEFSDTVESAILYADTTVNHHVVRNWIHNIGGTRYDHCLYVQDSTGLIANNILERACDFGIQFYPGGTSEHFVVNNTFVCNGGLANADGTLSHGYPSYDAVHSTTVGAGSGNGGGSIALTDASMFTPTESGPLRISLGGGVLTYTNISGNTLTGVSVYSGSPSWSAGASVTAIAPYGMIPGNGAGIVLGGNGTGDNPITQNKEIRNNIFYKNLMHGVETEDGQSHASVVVDHNLSFGHPNDDGKIGGSNYETASPAFTLSNSISGDPNFVDPGSTYCNSFGTCGDYHLQTGSPAIASGIEEYCPTVDFYGVTRTVADLGAIAYAEDDDGGPWVSISIGS